jgi:hypothetical protein
MNEADSSVEPEVKTRLDILFVKILNCIRFFLINCIVLKHYECQALKTGVLLV